jgi:hypothetical protein
MNNSNLNVMIFVFLLTLGTPAATVRADTVDNLATFSAGTTVRAGEVNGNFSEVADSVNDNDARIAALEDEIAGLRAQLSNVLNVNEYLSLETVNDRPTVRVSGANLQVVNGMGETATSNGTGNLLIGYDERRDESFVTLQCSLGMHPVDLTSVTTEAECATAGGVWAVNHTGGSHYLVVGSEHNYSRWGGIVVGTRNTSNFDFASVSGGFDNNASGDRSSVSGGSANTASGYRSSVSGGSDNTASGNRSSVSGGSDNAARGNRSSISGGFDNTARGGYSSVSGGTVNTADGHSSSVSGGSENNAFGNRSSVSGGSGNAASATESSVSGGFENNASGELSSIIGGDLNIASGTRSSVSGGSANTASGYRSSVSGGVANDASGGASSVSGGFQRSATGTDDWAAGSLSEDN